MDTVCPALLARYIQLSSASASALGSGGRGGSAQPASRSRAQAAVDRCVAQAPACPTVLRLAYIHLRRTAPSDLRGRIGLLATLADLDPLCDVLGDAVEIIAPSEGWGGVDGTADHAISDAGASAGRMARPLGFADGLPTQPPSDGSAEVVALDAAASRIELASAGLRRPDEAGCWRSLLALLQRVSPEFVPSLSPASAPRLRCWRGRLGWWQQAYFDPGRLKTQYRDGGSGGGGGGGVLQLRLDCALLIYGEAHPFVAAAQRLLRQLD